MSMITFRAGAWLKSGPVPDRMGAKAMATAMRMPPQATKGITWETPQRR